MLEDAVLWGAFYWVMFSIIDKLLTSKWIQKWTHGDTLSDIPFFCSKCWTFWLTLIITLNPFIAAGSALTIYLIEKNDTIKL